MASLIIRVSHSGNSEEYKFQKLGPIVIGSHPECDLSLSNEIMPSKLFEVKLSSGRLYLKVLSGKGVIQLNSVVIPASEECLYREGEIISFKDQDFKFQVYAIQEEEVIPPPFSEKDFNERLQVMNFRIREKEDELKRIVLDHQRKKEQFEVLEVKYDRHAVEKARLEVEISSLRTQKENLNLELHRGMQKVVSEEEKAQALVEHIKSLESEENVLRESVVAQTFVLNDLKKSYEEKNKDLGDIQLRLTNLSREEMIKEGELAKLKKAHEDQLKELKQENSKVEKILQHSDKALKESHKIEKDITQNIKEKNLLDHQIHEMQAEIRTMEDQRARALQRLSELRVEIEKSERESSQIQEGVLFQEEEEKNLKALNSEMRAELTRVEEKLAAKKNHLGQTEFQNQDAQRKLNTINFDIQRAQSRLQELGGEEKAYLEKIKLLKMDQETLAQTIEREREQLEESLAAEREQLYGEILALKENGQQCEKRIFDAESELSLITGKLEESKNKLQATNRERASVEAALVEFKASRQEIENNIKHLKTETLKLEHERSRAERELHLLEVKVKDCEQLIHDKRHEAEQDIENYRRDERAKIEAEKTIQLAEVEALRQRTMSDVEANYRQKLDEVHAMKTKARLEAEQIIEAAHQTENEITMEAQKRLQLATKEAIEREASAHDRVTQAQNYLKDKELEAERVLNKSRIESRQLLQKTESELLEDLSKRKQKIKKFLSMKQEMGLAHINSLQEQQILRMKKNEQKAMQRLEDVKKRELKKIARIREEELSRQHELKEQSDKDFRIEKEKALRMIQELKTKQEAELAEKKKTMIEHINSTKFTQKQSWEEELKREKEMFLKTKKDRIDNATMAVMNVLIAEIGGQGDNEALIKQKIRQNLEMAIDGQSAVAMKDVEQVLDFNPMKRKKMLPVLKKYALEAGIPAVIAVIMLADIGGMRTGIVDYTKDLMKQRESASEIYVNQQKNEWKEKHSFNPEMSVGYKNSYTDNVIYTTDFEKVMDNEEFQNDWILKVHDFIVKDLELSEDVAINFISAEGGLVKELTLLRKDLHPKFLDQGLKKMRDLEEAQLGWIKEKFVVPEKVEKFATFRKEYFDTFYKEKFNQNRGVASEAPSQTPEEAVP